MIQNIRLKAGWLRAALLPVGLALFVACGTPANMVYFQGLEQGDKLIPSEAKPIRLRPMDQISIIVNSRDPQVTAMFNLPYYTKRLGDTRSDANSVDVSGTQTGIVGYTVDSNGEIDFPIIGKIYVAGLTRNQVRDNIKALLIESRQIKDPLVTVDFMNLSYAVLGEVSRPGRFSISRDVFTILDAISLAGDLTINGEREKITVVRHGLKEDEVYTLSLMDTKELYASPAFYVQQGDVIYVTPNKKRLRESTVNGNNVYSASFWMSVSTLAMSVTTFIMNLTK